jgi:anhydro-N-acetylmuramic acid kinase
MHENMSKIYQSIGLMSGTSLDGVDLVYSKITTGSKYDYEIIHVKTYEYSEVWLNKLKSAFYCDKNDLERLDVEYGKFLGELVNSFIHEFQITDIDFVASHGHTIFHKPNEGYTLQIGCGKEIAKLVGTKVVYDFRTQDVEFGGQGAPLVPIGDRLFYSEFDFCLNLGGFANVSYEENSVRRAFDICPVNIVLNYYMQQIGEKYDDQGKLAESGKVNIELLTKLNNDPFYALPLPKSLGYEFVIQNVIPLIDSFDLEIEDVLRTFVEHVAQKISQIFTKKEDSKVLINGGGAYNSFLISRIAAFSSVEIIIPSAKEIEYKEALIFSLLGVLKIEGKPNCLQSVTGAAKNHSSGKVIVIELLEY